MDGLVFWAGLILFLLLVVAPILSIMAWRRSHAAMDELTRLRQRVTELESKLAAAPPPVQVAVAEAPEPQPHATDEADIIARVQRYRQKPPPAAEKPSPWEPAQTLVAETRAVPDAVPAASAPVQDIPPSQFSGMLSSLARWFMQGNPLAKLGILLLFLGLAYLFRYTVERDMFPLELRLIAAAVGSMGLLFFGFKLRHKQPLYGLILQGGATGALYLTVFGAFRLWQMLPMTLAFGLLLLICAASVGLAVLQKALSLAMLASIGGYLAPILLSTGSGNHIALFSFYLLLSAGILAISWWQHWRVLNLLGMAFTFGVAGLWGLNGYRPEIYLSSQLFLIANILLFGVLCVGLSLRAQESKEKIIDGVLLFAPPLIGFGMQYAITRHFEYGPALSALGFGLVYLGLGWVVLRRYPGQGKILVLAALALGGAFTTLAIPLALSARWTAMAWALEGLGIVWLGLQQRQRRMSYSGTGLLVLALGSAVYALSQHLTPLSMMVIFAVLSAAWLMAAWLWRAHQWIISHALLAGGIAFWIVALIGLADAINRSLSLAAIVLALLCASVWAWRAASQRLSWRGMGFAQWLLWPGILLAILFTVQHGDRLLSAGWTGLIWIAAFACAGLLLHKDGDSLMPRLSQAAHITLFWLLLLVIGLEIYWFIDGLPWGSDEWQAGIVMASAGIAILLVHGAVRRSLWPVRVWPQWYASVGIAPLIVLELTMLIFSNLLDGAMFNWRWVPLVNPLELGAGYGLLALYVAARYLEAHRPSGWNKVAQGVPLIIAGLAFWWANGLLLRTLAAYGDVAWQVDALWSSRLIQTTFALFWMLIALVVMVKATRSTSRNSWMAGAALLGVVIIKLMLVDSAGGGGLARAIAFIGVAVLVLIVGYFSPLPPKAAVNKAEPE
ncbi:DUF2339 domain-containing protein [Atlantibacter subterraneus]|uniref:DUF2339 domain-containing protein n=1 Tax=Atlantibacter subterraneus TaxID=255519 RepID=UPI0028AA4EA1|nr:DUF2339 domain-containing protein [Atlantibacter subterranea]